MTAPLHGFKGVDDYYQRASGRQFLADIDAPTLIVHASDDPFMGANVVPKAQELSPSVRYEMSNNGGHMGFVQRHNGNWRSWLPHRIIRFLHAQYKERSL